MDIKIGLGAAVALGVLLASCHRVNDSAVLECTALETGLVKDCVLIRASRRDFGEQALSEAIERGSRPYASHPSQPTETGSDSDLSYPDPQLVADYVTNIHPGYGEALPRRFRATIRVSY